MRRAQATRGGATAAARFDWAYGSKDHNANIVRRRIGSDVCKVQIDGEENAGLGPAHPGNLGVFGATKLLVVNVVALPSHAGDRVGRLIGHALVELRPHTTLRGQRQDALLRQVGRVRQGGLNGLMRQTRVASDDLVGGKIVGQVRQHDRHGDPRAPDTRLAVSDGRINGDVVLPSHEDDPRIPRCWEAV